MNFEYSGSGLLTFNGLGAPNVWNIVGFETGDLLECSSTATSTGTPFTVTSPVRNGTYSLKIQQGGTGVSFAAFAAVDNHGGGATTGLVLSYTRFFFRMAAIPTNEETFFYVQDNTPSTLMQLKINPTGGARVTLYNSAGTLVNTCPTTIGAGRWAQIEIKCGSGSNAAYEVRIDSVSQISGTANFGSNLPVFWYLGRPSVGSGGIEFYYDSLHINDFDFVGNGHVKIVRPDSDGTTLNWTANGAANRWDCVDEIPNDGDTTYISSATLDQVNEVNLESSSNASITGTIRSVKSVAIGKRVGGSPMSVTPLRVRMNSGGSIIETLSGGGDIDPILGYKSRSIIATANPSGGGNWSSSAIDSLQLGVKSNVPSSTGRTIRVTGLYAMVDTSDNQDIFTYETNGKLVFSGSLPQQSVYSYSASGLLQFTGQGVFATRYVYQPSGLLQFTGQGVFADTHRYNAFGMLQLFGQGVFAATYRYNAFGLLQFTGQGVFATNRIYQTSGLLQFTGQGVFATTHRYNAFGMLQLFGQGVFATRYVYQPIGLLRFDGLATTSGFTSFTYDASGLLLLTGQGVFATRHIYFTSGLLRFDGLAQVVATYKYFTSGLLRFDGFATTGNVAAFVHQAEGMLQFTGLITVNNTSRFYLASGLLQFTGQGVFAATYRYLAFGLLRLDGLADTNTVNQHVAVMTGKLFVTRGLKYLAHYSFDDIASPTKDWSGYGNHGAWVGTPFRMLEPATTNFVNIGSIDLDGPPANDYINVGTATSLQVAHDQAFSISGWIKVDTNTDGIDYIMSYFGGGSQGWFIAHDDGNGGFVSNGLVFRYHDGTAIHTVQSSASSITRNVFVHFCVTNNNTNTPGGRRIYINGVEDSVQSNSGTPGAINYTGTSFQIGAKNGTDFFFGLIDDIRVFDRELTAVEVRALSLGRDMGGPTATVTGTQRYVQNTGKLAFDGIVGINAPSYSYLSSGYLTFRDPTLVLWLRLDEGTGNIAYDSSLYKRDGSLQNMENGDWVTGHTGIKYGSPYALLFDGSDEFISIPATGLTNPNFTIVLWVNATILP